MDTMLPFFRRIVLIIGLLYISLTLAAQPALDSKDKRVYRRFVLENGLKVLLVSDPDVNVSSASLDVAVGSLADPENRMGMAHFLEHMLFLATKKYPELNSYADYLKSRGGHSNAYTAPDHTNYHFEVNHDGLPEALDRFGQFFIAPLLSYEYASREVQAVHSEHQKNIPEDNWRLVQLRRSLLRSDHPASKFHTGNLETLKGTTEKELQDFFHDYYGPERMALCVVSKLNLDRLEKLTREIFAGIKKQTLKPFKVSQDILDPQDYLRLIKVKPVKDIRQLRLFFPVPCLHAKALTKTGEIIGMTVGDESQGSLLSLLKKRGWATSLSAGVGDDTRFYSSCGISIGLTPEGLQAYQGSAGTLFFVYCYVTSGPFPRVYMA